MGLCYDYIRMLKSAQDRRLVPGQCRPSLKYRDRYYFTKRRKVVKKGLWNLGNIRTVVSNRGKAKMLRDGKEAFWVVTTGVFLIFCTENSQQRNYSMSSVHSNNCYWLRWLLSLKHYWSSESDHSSSTSLISGQRGECEGVRPEPGPAWVLSNIIMSFVFY